MKTLGTLLLILITNLIIIGSSKAQNIPVAVNDTFYVDYSDSAKTMTYNRGSIIYNDSDIDGNTLIIDTIFYNGVNTVTIQNHPSGWLKVYKIIYTTSPGYSGKDSITYYLTDNGSPTGFDTSTIYIYVKRQPYEYLDLNNISAIIHKNVLFQSNSGDVAGFNVPKSTNIGTIYASNLWVAGYDVNADIRVSGSTYNQNNGRGNAGPIMDSANYSYYSYQWDRVWKVSEIDIQNHIAGISTTEAITNWPAHGDTSLGQALNLAPFIDTDGDGIYNPLLGDYPKIKGQQTIYFIQNDKRDTIEPNILRIGVEIHGMAYSFNCPEDSALNNTVFVNYKVYNHSASPLFNTYIGLWSDIDIGNPNDDYFASDVARSSFYGYNMDNFDELAPTGYVSPNYGTHPPVQSVTYLKGLKIPNDGMDNPLTNNVQDAIDSSGIPYQGLGVGYGDGIVDNEYMGLTSFLTYEIDTLSIGFNEPKISTDYYNYLKGNWKNGAQMTWGGSGVGGAIPTNYLFPRDSDPMFWSTQGVITTPSPWNDVNFKDRRGIGSCGPFTFLPDSVVELDLAFVFARNYTDTSSTAAIPIMQNRIDVVRNYFINGFENICTETIVIVEDTLLDSLVVTVPNVFTPNSDGFNDNFVIQLQDAHLLESIEVGVFNRWGQFIIGSKFDANTLSKLPTINNQQQLTIWDGRTNSGKEVSSGTYFYIVTYVTMAKETKKVKGFLSLLR